jgi:lipopolysaccharide export system permease protein
MTLTKSFAYTIRNWLGRFALSLMDRYLFSQLIPPFLFSVGLVSSLGVAIGYLSDLSNKVVDKNLPLTDAIAILLLKVPEFTAYALPISLMLATLLSYGRLSQDSEIIALRSCGTSLYRIIAPALVLSFIVTGMTFIFSELVVPAANYRATEILVQTIQEEHPFWQNKDIFYPNYQEVQLSTGQRIRQLKSLFYAEKFDGQNMKDVTILEWVGGDLHQIIVSGSATWNTRQNQWDFYNGTRYKIAKDTSFREAHPFRHQRIDLPKAAFEFALQGRDPFEMNVVQAQQYIKLLRWIGDKKKLTTFEVRIQQKLAFPFICVVFGLVGSVLGVQPLQMSRGTSFGLSVLIIFGYYVLAFLMGSFGMIGLLTPWMAAWLPNIICLAIAGSLLYYSAR